MRKRSEDFLELLLQGQDAGGIEGDQIIPMSFKIDECLEDEV